MNQAVCCVLKKDNKFLTVSRKNDFSDYGFPGGKVDQGETLEEATIREVYEETGLKISNLRKIYETLVPRKDPKGLDFFATVFSADWKGEINTNEPLKIRWSTEEQLTQGSFAEYNIKILEKLCGENG